MLGITGSIYSLQYHIRQKALRQIGRSRNFFQQKNVPQIDPKTFAPKKVLFVICGLIGDSIMCIPALAEARKIWRDSHFTVLVKKHNHELLFGNTDIDEFYECNADPFSFRQGGDIKRLQSWLNAEHFDAAIILGVDQYAYLLAKSKIPVRVGVKGSVLEPYLTHTYDTISPEVCAANERLNSLRCLGYEVENPLPKLWVSDAARTSAKEKLVSCGLGSSEEYVVLHPFGSTELKWWDVRNITPLAHKLAELYGLKLVLVGKKYDLNGAVVVLPSSDEIDPAVVNTTGQLTLPELTAVIDDSKLIITTDSGPLHIAGALQKPTIGLFRARQPEHAGHYPEGTVIFGVDETCQMTCNYDFCRANPCRQLADISIESVLKEVDRRLK
jgi:ADP-heptose:LPS heptosyltransferase